MPVDPRAANRWLATIIPVVEVLIFIYSAYVETAEIAVNWLINPPSGSSHAARPGPAVAVLVIYYVLLMLALSSLFRILYVVHTDPGYIPLPQEESVKAGRKGLRDDGGDGNNEDLEMGALAVQSRPYGAPEPEPVGFYDRDWFICNPIGRPYWCDRCKNYKPDRTHHSSDVGRCVRGLDHFCPWAGGIIAENNHKFFNQFCLYTALICVHIIATAGVCVAEQRRDGLTDGHTFVCTVVLIPFAGFFGLFTATMFGVHAGYCFQNLTTVESLQMKGITYVAVYIGKPEDFPGVRSDVVHYPLPESGQEPRRTFAILKADPGVNVFDIGWRRNWALTMGKYPWDWILPVRRSPICSFSERKGIDCEYPLNEHMKALKKKWLNNGV